MSCRCRTSTRIGSNGECGLVFTSWVEVPVMPRSGWVGSEVVGKVSGGCGNGF